MLESDWNGISTVPEEAEAAGRMPTVTCEMPSGDENPCVTIDLFAGAGGLSLGATLAGAKVVAAVEQDPHACSTYRRNLIRGKVIDAKLFQRDIMSLEPREVMEAVGLEAGACSLLLGGPPCQGFSGHRRKDEGVNDPRNQLLLRYFEFVEAVRPSFFLVENVPGLLWPRNEKFLSAFYRRAEELEYEVLQPKTLNARNYGVPQNRKRVFLLGIDKRKELPTPDWPPPWTHDSPTDVLAGHASGRLPWRSAEDAFDDATIDDSNNIHMRHREELVKLFERTPHNGGSRKDAGRTLKCHEEHDGHSDVYGRINPWMPGPTMTTACINPSKGRFVHPTEHHGITVRQAARIQTFPEWFVFEGGLMAAGTQVGNAVPVEMARALVAPLVRAVRSLRL